MLAILVLTFNFVDDVVQIEVAHHFPERVDLRAGKSSE